jgi:hypothetical protein
MENISTHRLVWYLTIVATLTLIVALLQLFAGLHR